MAQVLSPLIQMGGISDHSSALWYLRSCLDWSLKNKDLTMGPTEEEPDKEEAWLLCQMGSMSWESRRGMLMII